MHSPDKQAPPAARQRHGVLVIGEALIDIVKHGEGTQPVEHVGGSPANVALALGRLGHSVRLLTAVGRDTHGARIEKHLSDSGVVVDPRSWTLERTSTACATIHQDGAATYDFDITWAVEWPGDPITAGVVHVGSVAAFLPPGAETVHRIVEQVAHDAIVSFDPNIRPALSGDRLAAIGQVESIAAMSDIVKLSDEDASWLYPEWPLDAVADQLLECGARMIALTAGASGALLVSSTARVQVPSPAVKVQDTVGAGDTFSAGLIDAVLRAPALLEALNEDALYTFGCHAAAAAAITVQRAGADPPTRQELHRAARAFAVKRSANAAIGLFAC
ncbi:carbohydrate kinase [Microbacterium sp. cx-59]|uniref:carbohydrate kinase family protein n=1 Tax=Microbacterium sp. cx-59 TaxID=2891207 RepID=UPI001E2B7C4C|nr:carbohydrate kinase [Microbacterium sp. cx-59]MCC4907686.1 carbohydrate kinase [Microbacterium sp. cx-59]